jgi:hypothetical protein
VPSIQKNKEGSAVQAMNLIKERTAKIGSNQTCEDSFLV